ncbi:prolyl oligopeptidase family serine peptidase [Phenylobacterium sp.]|uniref:S9 family peptidase n=1 Tax=Phenylobacterium sp. TaxID=1871053 RepID=UPI00356976AC
MAPARRRPRRSLVAVAAGLCVLLPAAQALGRPATVEDFLQRESLGGADVDPTGHWLVYARQGPMLSAARFDFEVFNDILRTRLMKVDLRHPSLAKPLFRAAAMAGYTAGPFSPDGRYLAVRRLTAANYELGVDTVATGRVRWLGVTPDYDDDAQTLAWLDGRTLLAIARPAGDMPFQIRLRHDLQGRLPKRWARSAAGGIAVTVLGSGPDISAEPPHPRRVLALDVTTGRRRVLATGGFIHLEVSPNGRRVALVSTAEDIPMNPGHPVQGLYGFENHRRRLTLLDVASGATATPCPACDVLLRPLAWSPDSRAVLVYARHAGQAWPEGRLLQVDAETAKARPAASGVRAVLDMRPEAARAGWFAGAPLLWGVRADGPPAATPGWFRIGPAGPIALTEGLQAPSQNALTVSPRSMLIIANGQAWRIAPDGQRSLVAPVFGPLRFEQTSRAWVYDYRVPTGERLVGLTPEGAGPVPGTGAALAAVDGGSVRDLMPVAAGSRVLTIPLADGAALIRIAGRGAVQHLIWRRPRQPPVEVDTLNPRLGDLDGPEVHAVRHPGPDGGTLTSWLLLPPGGAKGARPPPLVVWPYPGSVFTEPPAEGDLRRPGYGKTPALLVAHGYAVLIPSLPNRRDGRGPAEGLAQHTLEIVDAAAADPALKERFDPTRLGVWGHSFGGYAAMALVTQTDRFKAAIAQAGFSDLVSVWGEFAPVRRVDLEDGPSSFFSEGWTEDLQGDMRAPPWRDPQRYLRNSPLFQADRITTPLMLIHGDQDSIPVGQSEEMFSALLRQDKDAVLLTYWGEGHALGSPGNVRDLYRRAFAWLDEHLQSKP